MSGHRRLSCTADPFCYFIPETAGSASRSISARLRQSNHQRLAVL